MPFILVTLNRLALGALTAILTIVCALSPQPAQDALRATWSHPLPGTAVERYFDPPATRYSSGHRGIDFAARSGSPIAAPASGTVHFSGPVAGKPVLTVRVDEHTLYTFEPIHSPLQHGDAVTRGSNLGTVDAGGHCPGTCVHLGVRVSGEYVNPLRFFADRPRLLPLSHSSASSTE